MFKFKMPLFSSMKTKMLLVSAIIMVAFSACNNGNGKMTMTLFPENEITFWLTNLLPQRFTKGFHKGHKVVMALSFVLQTIIVSLHS